MATHVITSKCFLLPGIYDAPPAPPPPVQNQAQHMVVDMVALGVSAAVMFSVRHCERWRMVLPLAMFPVLAAADVWSIYNEIKVSHASLCMPTQPGSMACSSSVFCNRS